MIERAVPARLPRALTNDSALGVMAMSRHLEALDEAARAEIHRFALDG
jgi:hypothetical protein